MNFPVDLYNMSKYTIAHGFRKKLTSIELSRFVLSKRRRFSGFAVGVYNYR